MPSPFPGMDPYLEEAPYWRGLHNSLINYTQGELNKNLPTGYTAYTEERVYVIYPLEFYIPNVYVVSRQAAPQDMGSKQKGMPVADQPIEVAYTSLTVSELYIEIRTKRPDQRVVSVIEFLSPANKASGSAGREEYVKKQRDVLNSNTNLLEIDLLRSGQHTVAAPKEVIEGVGRKSYTICLSKADDRKKFLLWLMDIQNPLPKIAVPLAQQHNPDDIVKYECVIDLQAIFDAAYDVGPFRREVDYSAEPSIPLSPQESVWVDNYLRPEGLR